MKRSQPWHDTSLGVAACWLGSIQLAVPVLALVAAALGWGTYLESTQDARIARATVYGSWWFMGLMGLVCVSLIFAAVTRYPWKRRHVGFLTVHASLITLILAGFWSLFGRIEGRIALEQGMAAATIEMTDEQIEIVEHDNGQFRVLGETPAPTRAATLSIGGFPVQVVEVWDNVTEEFEVSDDGPEPYRAVQIAFGPSEMSAVWIGDEARSEPGHVDGLKVRVLAVDKEFTPPAPASAAATEAPKNYAFLVLDQRFPLAAEPAVGTEVFPGWKITAVKHYAHASVASGEITDDPAKPANPALEITLSNGRGSTERHTAFDQFPDMPMSKSLEGTSKSGARLAPPAALAKADAQHEETLVVYGQPSLMKAWYSAADGTTKQFQNEGSLPAGGWLLDCGTRKLSILKQLSKAQEHSKLSRAAPGKENRPAMVVQIGKMVPTPVAWKGMLPVDLPGRMAMLRYGPRTVTLPFSMRLDQFRKTDYPGTEMAMAYESDVTVSPPGVAQLQTTISMNNPLVQSGWKVYQSGFVGNNVSIFSVMRDPGLYLTYASCAGLCLGILITFYGRSFSWGHPGIPAPFSAKEQSHVPVPVHAGPVVHVRSSLPDSGGGALPAVDGKAGSDRDPGRRSSPAAGHVRA